MQQRVVIFLLLMKFEASEARVGRIPLDSSNSRKSPNMLRDTAKVSGFRNFAIR